MIPKQSKAKAITCHGPEISSAKHDDTPGPCRLGFEEVLDPDYAAETHDRLTIHADQHYTRHQTHTRTIT